MLPLKNPLPPTPGYEVEFIPVEHRLTARRLADREPASVKAPPADQPDRRKADRRRR